MTPRPGDTYFYQDRPVTVMQVDRAERRVQVRAGNASRKLDIWVTWAELGIGQEARR